MTTANVLRRDDYVSRLFVQDRYYQYALAVVSALRENHTLPSIGDCDPIAASVVRLWVAGVVAR